MATSSIVARQAADATTTEIVRRSLESGAEQMKRALIRTAFSPVIYEGLDFAVALYDPRARLLAQAPSLPVFMGTLNFCIEAAFEGVGGESELADGDILVYNLPYSSGTHQQDVAMIMPVFGGGNLVGYSAIKAHWLDLGAKDPYCTDTEDIFQEGLIFPGVKLYSAGVLDDGIFRMALANSRVPKSVAGDIEAQVVGVRAGASELRRVVERFGLPTFESAVEQIFDQGEALVRNYFTSFPDGTYVGHGKLDNDGIDDTPIPYEVIVEVDGSDVRIDYSRSPEEQLGPVNSPLPITVSASRVAIAMLAGAGESPNEGSFRAIEVLTRPGSMFDPNPPVACFLGTWSSQQAIEVIYRALAEADPTAVPAASGADTCVLTWWGKRAESGETWADGITHPVGQGAHSAGDGASSLMYLSDAGTRFAPVEVWESRNPWYVEQLALAQDSCGAGEHRGGLGINIAFHLLEDCWMTSATDRTTTPPPGLSGGGEARPNRIVVRRPDEDAERYFGKVTRLAIPKDTVVEMQTGGGGGYGDPARRPTEIVNRDLEEGYVSPGFAARHYARQVDQTG